MKSPADLKTLTNLIKFLQKQGCIVSASGLLALPFKFTKKNLSVDHEDVVLHDAIKLERWLSKMKLHVRKGDLGVDNTVVVADAANVDVCKLVANKSGGWLLKQTANWAKPKKAKRTKRIVVKSGHRANRTIH